MTIVAAADGSALGNPGPAGWAWYVNDDCWAAGGWPHGTNNQGELMAVLDLFTSTAHLPDEGLHILCDSQYVINAVSRWMPGWKRKGWRKADGKPVLNLDLLQRLDAAIAGRRYSFEWVKGHAGHDLNEAADERARAVATAYQNRAPIPTGPGWASRPSPASPAVVDSGVMTDAHREAFSDSDSDSDTVAGLETRLLSPATRSDPRTLETLLHPEFIGIGGSGAVTNREAAIRALVRKTGDAAALEALGVHRVSDDTILLTYRSTVVTGTVATGRVMRASLWCRENDRWQLRFRQDTPDIRR